MGLILFLLAVILPSVILFTIVSSHAEIHNQCKDWSRDIKNAAVWGSVGNAFDQCMKENWIVLPKVELPQVIKIKEPTVN